MKNYKKGLVFLMAKTLKYMANHSLASKAKLAKVFLQQPIPFKANDFLYFNDSQHSRAIQICKNLSSITL